MHLFACLSPLECQRVIQRKVMQTHGKHANSKKVAGLIVSPSLEQCQHLSHHAARKTSQVASVKQMNKLFLKVFISRTFCTGPWPTWAEPSWQRLGSACAEATSGLQGPDLLALGCPTTSPGWSESRGRNDKSWRRECWPAPRSVTNTMNHYSLY